jgi:hypothetical protein
MPRRRQKRPSLLARATASLAIFLVLALAAISASPELHGRLHGHEPGAASAAHPDRDHGSPVRDSDDDAGCVVTLFAQGIVFALALAALALTGPRVRLSDFAAFERIFPKAPPFLHLPTQAPPAPLG